MRRDFHHLLSTMVGNKVFCIFLRKDITGIRRDSLITFIHDYLIISIGDSLINFIRGSLLITRIYKIL